MEEGQFLSLGGHALAYNILEFKVNEQAYTEKEFFDGIWLADKNPIILDLKFTKKEIENVDKRLYLQANRKHHQSIEKYVKFRVKNFYISTQKGDRDVNVPVSNFVKMENIKYLKTGEFKKMKSI